RPLMNPVARASSPCFRLRGRRCNPVLQRPQFPEPSPRRLHYTDMGYRFLADALVVFHLCFVIFVIGGGLLVLRWRRAALLHVPAVLWGIWVECSGWLCPL